MSRLWDDVLLVTALYFVGGQELVPQHPSLIPMMAR
jgi:hypothetical protein